MMRVVIVAAAAVALASTLMARQADRAPLAAAAVIPVATAAAGQRVHAVARDGRGHFATEARIDGQRIGVMVDTGASLLALNESSAARIGVRPRPMDYTAGVNTANGVIKAARARVARVDIGEISVRDVDAVILPDTALSENLLGLSFLSKLKRYEFAGGKLVMEQ